jgi:hypothetical protein
MHLSALRHQGFGDGAPNALRACGDHGTLAGQHQL